VWNKTHWKIAKRFIGAFENLFECQGSSACATQENNSFELPCCKTQLVGKSSWMIRPESGYLERHCAIDWTNFHTIVVIYVLNLLLMWKLFYRERSRETVPTLDLHFIPWILIKTLWTKLPSQIKDIARILRYFQVHRIARPFRNILMWIAKRAKKLLKLHKGSNYQPNALAVNLKQQRTNTIV